MKPSGGTAYLIELTEHAVGELKPTVATRNRKRLEVASPSFEHVPPIWELRVGEYRVFYDVDESARTVYVRAVRLKEPHQTTEDITR